MAKIIASSYDESETLAVDKTYQQLST